MRNPRLLSCAGSIALIHAASAEPPALPDLPDEPVPQQTSHTAGKPEPTAPQAAAVNDPGVTIHPGVAAPVLRRCFSLDRLKQSFDVVVEFAFINTKDGLQSPPDAKARNTVRARIDCEAHAYPAGVRAKATIETISVETSSGDAAKKAAFDAIASQIKSRSITIVRHDNGELEAAFPAADGMGNDAGAVLRFLTDAMIVSMPRLPRSPIGPAASWDVRARRGVLGYETDLAAHHTLVNWFDGGRLFVDVKSDESAAGNGAQGQHVEVSRHVEGHSIFFPADILPRESKHTVSTRLADPSASGAATPVHQEWLTSTITLVRDEPPTEMHHFALRVQDLLLGSSIENPGGREEGLAVSLPQLKQDGEGEPPDERGVDLYWRPANEQGRFELTWHKEKRNEFAGGVPMPWELGDDWTAMLDIAATPTPGAGASTGSVITAKVLGSSLDAKLLPPGATLRFTLGQLGEVSDVRLTNIDRDRAGSVRAMRTIAQTLTHCYASVGPFKYDADARWSNRADAEIRGVPCLLLREDQIVTKKSQREVKSTCTTRAKDAAAEVQEFDDGRLTLQTLSGVTRGEATFAAGSLLPTSAWFFQEDDCRGEVSTTIESADDARVTWPFSCETLAKIELRRKELSKLEK